MQVKYVMWLKLSLKCSIVSFCWWQPYYNFKEGLQISNLYKFKILVISIILISDGWQGRKKGKCDFSVQTDMTSNDVIEDW